MNEVQLFEPKEENDGMAEKLQLGLKRELRKIEGYKLTKLCAIIDDSNDYERLLEGLTRPGEGGPCFRLNIPMETINLIKNQIHCGKSPTMALLNHWSITGRRRPTVETLIQYLQLCDMKRALNYVLQEILMLQTNRAAPPALAESSPVEPVAYTIIEDAYKFQDLQYLAEELSPGCQRYSFDLIYQSTNRFCHKPHDFRTKSGAKIGEGRFSSVYRAQTRPLCSDVHLPAQIVAAKLLKSDCNKTYLVNEINLIRRVNHENVLELLGIALGPDHQKGLSHAYICLIYRYMENGSLLECLASGLPTRQSNKFLEWPERVIISTKVARGISYLHNFPEGPIIHRDIKTANILLNENLEPKLGDFTIVRQMDSNQQETQYSQNVVGTSIYMPPEAFRGDISLKLDSFSFGIVLLELLTGMSPFDEKLDEDLLTYITERLSDLEDSHNHSMAPETTASIFEQAKDGFLMEILDKKADDLDFTQCKLMFNLAIQATESRKNSRPTIDEVLGRLEQMSLKSK